MESKEGFEMLKSRLLGVGLTAASVAFGMWLSATNPEYLAAICRGLK